MLRHLKRSGFSNEELVKVYKTNLRSALEFASVVYGPLLTADQSEDLERLQRQCLKIIYGFEKSYQEILDITGLEKLEARREAAIIKFAQKCLNGSYGHWFPQNPPGRTRKQLKFREDFARCDRLRKTPIYHMRRVMNELYKE